MTDTAGTGEKETKEAAAQGEVFFYHLTRSPLEAALPMLLERSLR